MRRMYLIPLCLALLISPVDIFGGEADWIDAFRSVATPLEEAWEALMPRMAEASLVLLGEASHGTAEYYTLRGRISLGLIQNHGFRFVAVEGDWNAIHRLHRYVTGQNDPPGGAAAIMQTFTRWPQWMWANQEFADFVEALRDWNLERPFEQRAGLFGIDVYGFADAVNELPQALSATDPELAARIQPQLDCFRPFLNDMAAYARAARMGPLSPCAGAASAVLRLLETADLDWDAETRLHLLQMARVIHSAERHYRTMAWDGPDSWNHRASHFFETTQQLRKHYGEGSQGIVWAHNTHIGDARATDMSRFRQHNIGQLARETLGNENVFALGFATYQGTLLAGRQWGGTRLRMTKPRPPAGTAEFLKHQASPQNTLFDFRDAPEILQQQIGHRAAGVIYHPERENPGNYVPSALSLRYDALIFLPATTALTPMDPSASPGSP